LFKVRLEAWKRISSLVFVAIICFAGLQRVTSGDTLEVKPDKRYAVVVSDSTFGDSDWSEVVEILQSRHKGRVFTHIGVLDSVQHALALFGPKYICFVASPEEIISYEGGCEQYVRDIYRLTRSLDDDVYGDAIWGIITGYDVQDALRVANGPSRISVSNALLATAGGWLDYMKQGVFFSEGRYELMWTTDSCGAIDTSVPGPTDPTDRMVSMLNSEAVDIMVTSGHASQRRWKIHYPDSGLAGLFRSHSGQLYGDPHSGPNINVNSANPKVYYAPGNCLIGDISDMDCMALAWIHTGGAYQFCGYIVKTWYGYMGWGVADYFFPLQNRFSFAEAFYLNNQALLYDLENATPGTEQEGLSHDRDVVVLYGDPACEVRLEVCQEPVYDQELIVPPAALSRSGMTSVDTVVFRFTMNEAGHPRNHPIALFTNLTADSVKILSMDAHGAVVTDNFVLLDVWHKGDPELNAGEQREVTFSAQLRRVTDSHTNSDTPRLTPDHSED
jgi:zinc protease